jgi:hypothetical protein
VRAANKNVGSFDPGKPDQASRTTPDKIKKTQGVCTDKKARQQPDTRLPMTVTSRFTSKDI